MVRFFVSQREERPEPDLSMPPGKKAIESTSSDQNSVKGKDLDTYMDSRGYGREKGGFRDEDKVFGGIDPKQRQLDSRTSSRLDSRGSTGYDTFTDSVVDERHEKR